MARIRAGGQPSSRLPGNPRLSAGPRSQFWPPGASPPVSRKPTQPPEEAARSDPESPALRAPLRRHLLDAPGPRAAVTLCHRLGGLKHTALLSRAGGRSHRATVEASAGLVPAGASTGGDPGSLLPPAPGGTRTPGSCPLLHLPIPWPCPPQPHLPPPPSQEVGVHHVTRRAHRIIQGTLSISRSLIKRPCDVPTATESDGHGPIEGLGRSVFGRREGVFRRPHPATKAHAPRTAQPSP